MTKEKIQKDVMLNSFQHPLHFLHVNEVEILNQVQDDNMVTTHGGFTLIELLVVLLIIGILTAVAVPMYQKAIWKSRVAQLRTSVSALVKAQEVFYLANGRYATKFSELDISFDNFPLKPKFTTATVSSQDAVRANDWAEIIVNVSRGQFTFSAGIFKTGPYAGNGFSFQHDWEDEQLPHGWLCFKSDQFCRQLLGISAPRIYKWSTWLYPEN